MSDAGVRNLERISELERSVDFWMDETDKHFAKKVELEKKLEELTEKYSALADKYNDLADRLIQNNSPLRHS